MKKNVLFGWILLLVFICGCGKKGIAGINDPEKAVKQYLSNKYNMEFEILTLEKVNIGQNFAEYIYQGSASTSGTDGVFYFTVEDKKTFRDNYPMLLYNEQAHQDVEDILSDEKLFVEKLELIHTQSKEKYADYDEYIQNHNVTVHGDFVINIEDKTDACDYLYSFLEALKEEGYYTQISVSIGETRRNVIYCEYIEFPAREKIYDTFE